MRLKNILLTTLISAATLANVSTAQNAKYGYDKTRMDISTKPGDNFYQYACGSWIKGLPEKPESSRYNHFDILQEENERRIIQIITDASNSATQPGSLAQQIGDYYKVFMDSTRRNSEGAAPLAPYINMVKNIENRNNLLEIVAAMYRHGVNNLFMAVQLQGDITDASRNIVCLRQGGLTLPNRDYYTGEDSSVLRIRYAYHRYIQNVFKLSGYSGKEAFSKTQDVNYIEHKIAECNSTSTQLRDVKSNFHKMPFDSLYASYPGIDWNIFFHSLGYNELEYINVAQPKAIMNVAQIISGEDLSKLKNYIEFKIIASGASSLSDDFVRENFLLNQALNGTKIDKPRWKKAINDINSLFGMGLGKLYVEKYFPEESKNEVLDMVKNIQNALKDRISGLDWMSEQTKAKAIEKLEGFYVKIGYPNKWQDYSGLTIDPRQSLYENSMNVKRFLFDYERVNKVNKPVDRDEWHMTPQTINAYYNPNTNEITFPAAILQAPFFDSKADCALNYGGIGCVIGHEMTHGFDDQGCQFDKHGNFSNWWTAQDKDNFESRAKLMEEFYNKKEVLPGEFCNGKLTLGENIADNGGINIAFIAMENHLKEQKSQVDDGFTPEQRFFLNYAYIWGGTIRMEEQRKRLKSDPHSPMVLRVNGQLPHLDQWYNAFGISKKAGMYISPKKRVNIW